MQAGHRAELFSAGAGLHPFVSSKTPENENTASVRLRKLRLHGRTVCRYDYFLCPGCVARHFFKLPRGQLTSLHLRCKNRRIDTAVLGYQHAIGSLKPWKQSFGNRISVIPIAIGISLVPIDLDCCFVIFAVVAPGQRQRRSGQHFVPDVDQHIVAVDTDIPGQRAVRAARQAGSGCWS